MGNTMAVTPCGLSKSARVVQPDGKVLLLTGRTTKVGDLLLNHPHHYICKAGRAKEDPKGSMLPLEMELEPGQKYLLLPLPRLFSVQSYTRRSSMASPGCCLSFVAGGFPVDSDSDDIDYRRPVNASHSLGALLAMDNYCTGLFLKLAYCRGRGPPARTTPMTLEMKEILKNAEKAWKEMNEMTGAWRPDLESINEENIRRSPLRQTLASLMGIDISNMYRLV